MDYILFAIIFFLVTNLLYGLFFLLAYRGISNLYEWISEEQIGIIFNIGMIVFFPLLGLSYHTATFLYEKFNWFFARLLVLFYLIILITLILFMINVFGSI